MTTESVFVYKPEPGDRIIIEWPGPVTFDQQDRFKAHLRARLRIGEDIEIVVLSDGAHFAGVVRS